MKILLVDDAIDTQLIVQAALSKKFTLKCVSSAEEAAQELARVKYSLLIFDVGLPGEDGFKLCANVRADETYRDVPIIFLTGKNQTRDKVLAFTIGADDYICKPFDPTEFQARIEAKMRRMVDNHDSEKKYSRGPFSVAFAEQKIFMDVAGSATDLGLSTIEFKLFYFFLRHEEHVLSRGQILDEVWGHGTHVTDRAVDTYVYSLRKKLGTRSGMLQSVPRVGYRLSLSETMRAA